MVAGPRVNVPWRTSIFTGGMTETDGFSAPWAGAAATTIDITQIAKLVLIISFLLVLLVPSRLACRMQGGTSSAQ